LWGSQKSARDFVIAGYGPDPEDAPVEDPEFLRWNAKLARYAASPTSYEAFLRMWYETDVRDVLPAIHVPTAVVSWSQDSENWAACEDYLLAHITGAQRLPVPGCPVVVWLTEPDPYVAAVESFLASVAAEETELDRVLATVLFTDVVGSTDKAAELGDARWGELPDRHHAAVRALLARYRGTEVKTMGDGFLATFDGPARAVRCAQGICETVKGLGLEVRAGCHTGEIELQGSDVGGIAVHIGARVGALARPSEVLVSSTVRDLVVGAGFSFTDRGEHELKGVPGIWRLYAANPAAS
jgi:class 3 adenylate cyclase